MPLIASFLVITTRTFEAFNPTTNLLAYQARTPGKKDRKKNGKKKVKHAVNYPLTLLHTSNLSPSQEIYVFYFLFLWDIFSCKKYIGGYFLRKQFYVFLSGSKQTPALLPERASGKPYWILARSDNKTLILSHFARSKAWR